MKALTALQKRFCDIILLMELAGEVNQQKAYELAGYKCRGKTAKTEASRTLSKPPLKKYLARARKRRAKVVEKTEAEIIREYEKLGFLPLYMGHLQKSSSSAH
ncbi:MAG: terminase small subunit [Planctomycetes bacterium]|nr:terminase small subunit [Planctomycetota bacterium]